MNRVEMNQGFDRFQLSTGNGLELAQAFEVGLGESRNFEKVWLQRQDQWPSLNTDYVKWKEEHGFPSAIWALTGNSIEGLSTPVNVSEGTASNGIRDVFVVENFGGRIVMDWTMKSPAAAYAKGESRFWFNNEVRRFADVILPESWTSINARLHEAITAIIRSRSALNP